MPIYDFRCLECGKISEVFIRGGDQDPRCQNCGSTNVERLMSSSYMVKTANRVPGATCCGRAERCEAPPCSTGGACRRH